VAGEKGSGLARDAAAPIDDGAEDIEHERADAREGHGGLRKKQECSFLKKRTKNFSSFAYAAGSVRDSTVKVFFFFSSEKKTFLLLCATSREMLDHP